MADVNYTLLRHLLKITFYISAFMQIGYLQCAILMLSIIYNVFFSVWLHFFYKFFCYHASIITITYYLIILLSLVNY